MSVVLAWVIVSLLGAAISLYLTVESIQDLRALGPLTNGRRAAAVSRLIREGVRVSVHLTFIYAGLAALELVPGRELIVPILIYGNVALVVNSIIDARARTLMLEPIQSGSDRSE